MFFHFSQDFLLSYTRPLLFCVRILRASLLVPVLDCKISLLSAMDLSSSLMYVPQRNSSFESNWITLHKYALIKVWKFQAAVVNTFLCCSKQTASDIELNATVSKNSSAHIYKWFDTLGLSSTTCCCFLLVLVWSFTLVGSIARKENNRKSSVSSLLRNYVMIYSTSPHLKGSAKKVMCRKGVGLSWSVGLSSPMRIKWHAHCNLLRRVLSTTMRWWYSL